MAINNVQEFLDILNERIKKRGGKTVCPICGGEDFGGYCNFFMPQVHREVSDKSWMNSKLIPTIVIACKNCVYMSQHLLEVLDPDYEKRCE